MIVVNDVIFNSRDMIEQVREEMLKEAYKPDLVAVTNIYYEYLNECFEADIRLQEMVSEQISDKYISFVILPLEETQLLDGFYFNLVSEDENEKIKKRDELLYENLYTICFGGIQSFYKRLMFYYSEP